MIENNTHMFCLGDMDFLIARDITDAWAVWCEATGSARSDFVDDAMEMIPDNRIVRCWVDGTGSPTEHGNGEIRAVSAATWAAQLGRGLAFSEEP